MEPTTLIDREHKNVVLCVPVLTPAEQAEYLRNFDTIRVLERFGLDPAEYKAVRVTFRVDDFLEKFLMSLPAVVVNGGVVFSGGVPDAARAEEIVKAADRLEG